MASSFLISVGFFVAARNGHAIGTDRQLLFTVIATTICWVPVAYFGPQTDSTALTHFYRKVRPFGPGWRRIRIEAGVSEAEAADWAQDGQHPAGTPRLAGGARF